MRNRRRKLGFHQFGKAPLTRQQAEQLMTELSGAWVLTREAQAIRREFAFRDFYRTDRKSVV